MSTTDDVAVPVVPKKLTDSKDALEDALHYVTCFCEAFYGNDLELRDLVGERLIDAVSRLRGEDLSKFIEFIEERGARAERARSARLRAWER